MRFLRQSLMGLVLLSLTLGLLLTELNRGNVEIELIEPDLYLRLAPDSAARLGQAIAAQLIGGAVQTRMADEPRVPQARERVFAVNVVPVVFGTETPILTAFGEVQSRRTLELRTAVGGALMDLAPEFVEGGRVEAGQVLARIDPAEAQAALDRADLRDRAFQRQKDLADRGVGTAAAVETAELAASAARAQVLTRRQALAQAEARIDQAATSLA